VSASILPEPSRPTMPKSYGVPTDLGVDAWPSWPRISEMLANARNYWISTTRPNKRPHAMPVWGLWLGEAFYFRTSRDSKKGRNLATNPWIVVHLESGDDAVILEGTVEEVTDPLVLGLFKKAYESKYQWGVDLSDPHRVTYGLKPRVAFTWLEKDFPDTATRWRFGQ
jgi:general stress protein 26